MDTELLMGKAKESLDKLIPGTRFVVKDLFVGIDWDSLD